MMSNIENKNTIKALKKYGDITVLRMAKMLQHTTKLKNDLVPVVKTDGVISTLEIQMPSYAIFVNDGRRKGAKMPPLEPISLWAKSKSIIQFRDKKGRFISNESRAWLISRKIARDGIKPIPFMKLFADHMDELNKMLGPAAAADYAEELRKIVVV